MNRLKTPLGDIAIYIDDVEINYTPVKKDTNNKIFPDVLARYFITIHFKPDGKEHMIKCLLLNMPEAENDIESGECLELQSFISEDNYKLSIGCEGESGYLPNGERCSDRYDYDNAYFENGVGYELLKSTKTCDFVFGLAWIDKVYDDLEGSLDAERDIQTWYAADPTIRDTR